MSGRHSLERLFALAALASATGQHDRAVAYAGEAVATARRESAAVQRQQLSRTTFDRLTVSYKSLVDDRRVGWRTLDDRRRRRRRMSSRSTVGDDGRRRDRSVAEYARRLARETVQLSRDFCAIVDRHVLPGLDAPTDVAHAHKLKADFYRYTYEVSDGDLKEWSAAKACRSYQRGYDTLLQCRARYGGPVADRALFDLSVNFAVCLECVFGADHAAAFVRRALATAAADCALQTRGDGSKSLRDLLDRLTTTTTTSQLHATAGRAGRDDTVAATAAAVDLGTGFCVCDASDAEPEF